MYIHNNNLGHPLFGLGGGYSGPSAAQLEAQAQADFNRQKEMMKMQAAMAEEERVKSENIAAEKAAKAAAEKESADAERKRKEDMAATEAAASAADVNYDPNSGSVMSLLRSGVQIPEGNSSNSAQ